MIEIANRYITSPAQTPGDDGLGFWNGEEVCVHDCYIDLQANPVSSLDEAVGITYGASGVFERCVIRGAGKLILCGSGDKKAVPLEDGKTVTFKKCIIEQGGRRFPEVQDGMHVQLKSCLVQDWGMKSRFIDRGFGAWAHKDGSIYAEDCVFRQQSLRRGVWYWLMDKAGHIGQAVNEDGLSALFRGKTYVAGTRRALTAQGTGYVYAVDCWKSHDSMLVENCQSWMDDASADELVEKLEQMRADLKKKLGIE